MNVLTKLKTDVAKYASVQLFSKGLSLSANYIIAFLTTNEIFGYIALLQASFLVAITIFGFNLQSGFVRYYFTMPLSKIFKYTLPIFLVLFLFSLFFSLFLFFFLDLSGSYKSFYWLPIIGFLSGIGFIFSILARGNNKFNIYAFCELVRPILLFLISLSLIFLDFNIVDFYIFVLFISSFLVFLYGFINIKQLININLNDEGDILTTKIILIYTFPLFLSQVMSLINNVSDKYILNLYLDIEKVGLYGKAYIFGSSIGLIFDSFMLLWLPYVMKHKSLILSKYFQLITKIIYLTFMVASFFFILSFLAYNSNILVFERDGGGDRDFILVVFLVISAFIFRIGYQVFTPILSAFDQTLIVAQCSIFSMLIGLVFNLIFIPYLGVIAAALSTLISFLFYSLSSMYFTRRLYLSINKSF